MKLKVCGLKERENIEQVVLEQPEFIGFIFHPSSPRFVDDLSADFVREIQGPKKVGVFVHSSVEEIKQCVKSYGLDLAQLHGDQSLEFMNELISDGVSVIKVFRVHDELPSDLDKFSAADYHLFDTKTESYGGSGMRFDWSVLKDVNHPFLLSGGIDEDDIAAIKALDNAHLIGIDINSRFEIQPGIKNIEKINAVKRRL